MKTVVLNRDLADAAAATCGKYYGIALGKQSGFVTRFGTDYKALAAYHVTDGNNWPGHSARTLPALLESLLKSPAGFAVYEFETEQELFGWLSNRWT